jgi:nucleoside-diphosphate-sugar epimerase
VYHLAAYAAEGLSHSIRAFNYRNNLLVACPGNQRCDCAKAAAANVQLEVDDATLLAAQFYTQSSYESSAVQASMHLVNEAVNNKVDVFVFTSSIAVYGTNQAQPPAPAYTHLAATQRHACTTAATPFATCSVRQAPARPHPFAPVPLV